METNDRDSKCAGNNLLDKEKDDEDDSEDSDGDDDSPEDNDTLDEGASSGKRSKRSVSRFGYDWCGTESSGPAKWPPDPQTVGTNDWRNLRHVRPGNPYYGPKMQLYSRTRMFLAIYSDGTVKGTADNDDIYTGLELSSAGYPGHVRIQGIDSKLYLCMDRRGWLYGEADQNQEGTVFIEAPQSNYKTYLSRKFSHLGWYVAIKKNGKRRKGPKTAYGTKATHFLAIRSKYQ